MKTLTKFAFFAALCGVFAACGGDSGSNSSGSELPESIKNFSDIADYDCNDARQCAKLYVEEYSDTMQCVNGEWETLISSMKNACSDSEILGDVSSSSLNASSSSHSELVSESTSSSSSENVDSVLNQVQDDGPQGDVSSSSDESSSSSVESSSSEVSSSSVVEVVGPSSVIKGTMTDARDGMVYKTVTIGEQTWMAENLNYAYNVPTSTLDSSSFCYKNKVSYCGVYGRLYLWSAAMDSAAVFSDDGKDCGYNVECSAKEHARGVCPEGWHLPSSDEWSTLVASVGGADSAGIRLKSLDTWCNSAYGPGVGDDSYGFNVLPAGYSIPVYDKYDEGQCSNAAFWTSYSDYKLYAIEWFFNCADEDADYIGREKYMAFSVRCLKD